MTLCCAIIIITYEIYKFYGCNPPADMEVIFLGILKAFGYFESLANHILKSYGIGDDLLKLLTNYLEDRKQRVVLNG